MRILNRSNRIWPSLRHSPWKQRSSALFLCLVFVVSIVTSPATVLALESRGDPPKLDALTRQDYPGPLGGKTSGVGTLVAPTASRSMGERLQQSAVDNSVKTGEIVEKRTAYGEQIRNADGTVTERKYFSPINYQKDGKWQKIDTTLVEDKNAGDASNFVGEAYGQALSWFSSPTNFIVADNSWQARFGPSDFEEGMVRVRQGDSQIGFIPIGAKQVAPVITTDEHGRQTVHYYDLWPGVNVEYVVSGGQLKESIVLKDKNATSQVQFRVVGATLAANANGGFAIKGAFDDAFSLPSLNLMLSHLGPVTDTSVFGQTYSNGLLTLSIDKAYLGQLPASAFPAVLDPGIDTTTGMPGSGDYRALKSDGYACSYTTNPQCKVYVGGLDSGGGIWKYWRSAYYAPYSTFQNPNKRLVVAKLYLNMQTGAGSHGTTSNRYVSAWRSTCNTSFSCVDANNWGAEVVVGSAGELNVTDLYKSRIAAGDFGMWLMLVGEEAPGNSSFKELDPAYTYMSFTWGDAPPAPPILSPEINGKVFVDPQVSFRLQGIANPNNSTPLQYEFQVSSAPGGVGTLINSGQLSATQWTIPDGMLQDGSTYYVQVRSCDPSGSGCGNWSGSINFRIDMRTGKDATQTYDSLGPVDVNLATGNVATSAASHTSAALGGNMGVSLDYNSPVKSRPGLNAEYWNNASMSGTPFLARVDQNVDFDWAAGSPSSGIGADNFSAKWTGYFVAPSAGTYYFGANNDDSFTLKLNAQTIYTSTGCAATVCYGAGGVSLSAGQVVPIEATYAELSGTAAAKLWAKGPVAEGPVPSAWLQTAPRPTSQANGLVGRYYVDDGTHNFSSPGAWMFMQRTDAWLNFDWAEGAPIADVPTSPRNDNFMVRWSGYFTPPVTGNYTFGANSDDGVRVNVNGSQTLNEWQDQTRADRWGGSVSLTQGVSVPITVEYFEHTGGAIMALKVKGAVDEQLVPSSWLSPKAQVLPEGWSFGIDPDGDLTYDRAKINQNSVVLSDSAGDTHEYTYANGGYKPPVNEDGQLVRNADGSLTLQDTDGRTYVFSAGGELTSATNPTDDRKPAALKYEYSGTPAKIQYIRDGVDPSGRWARVYYSGEPECGTAPTGFDGSAPAGMLCALKTNDGRFTYFYYNGQRLARIARPGNELTDYQYDTPGRITAIRDSLASDAVAAGARTDDTTVLTELSYDALGRVVSVKQPAATAGANRIEHTIEYLPGTSGYFGATQQHITGASEPNGFGRRVEYDGLFRTTKVTDVANLGTLQEWDATKDLLLSTTDPPGLRATTIYDDEDRATDSYGPAPSAWFGTDRKPQTAYAAQVPHNETKYDEGITGPQVAWHDVKDNGGKGVLLGAPRLHATGIAANTGLLGRDFRIDAEPFTVDPGMSGYGFSATGKLRLPGTGTYTLKLYHDDGARVWVDDQLVVDDWDYRSEGIAQNLNTGTFVAEAGKVYRFRFDYMHLGTQGGLALWIAGPGITDTSGSGLGTHDWSAFLKPGYSLVTSTKTYDSTIGDTVATTSYGPTPELGLAQSSTLDPAGLNLTTTNTYEPQGATGSYLRQTAKHLPGANPSDPATGTQYTHYTAVDTRDNPCTTGVTESYKQAGFIKLKTEADPDGPGIQIARTTESIYDDTGRTVASRTNNDAWTCVTYDSRGRVIQTVVPTINGRTGRTVTSNYNYQGSPFKVQIVDSVTGTTSSEIDLLGRAVSATDVFGNTSTVAYDTLGRVSTKTSPIGAEGYTYDTYSRVTEYLRGGVKYATITYDAYSRVQDIIYNQAQGQAAAIPVIQSTNSGSVSSGALTLNKPTATAAGDLLIMTASADLSAAESVTYTIPSGWTQLLANTRSDASGAGNNLQVWYKLANSSEPSTYSITPDHTNLIGGSIARVTGHDAANPIDVSGVTASPTGEASAPAVTTTVANDLVLRLVTWDQSKTINSIPTGHTQSHYVDVSGHDNWGGYKTQASAGSTGIAQFDLSAGAPYVGFTVAIKPTGGSNNTLKLEQLKRDSLQRSAGAVYRFSNGSTFDETVARTQGGTVASYTDTFGSNSAGGTYTYDKAGRLTGTAIDNNTYSYGYGAPSGATCNQAGANLNSHKNSNRTSFTVNGQTTTYCYDQADRLLSSTDTQLGTPTYDDHGNTVSLAGNGTPITFTYDASDSNTAIEQGANKTTYLKTASGSVLRKKEYVGGALTKSYRYLAGGAVLQTCSLADENSCTTTDTYLGLHGGVTLTLSPTNPDTTKRTMYSIKNFHGDTAITANEYGAPTSSVYLFEPFGQASSSSTFGTNSSPANATDQSMGWAANPTRKVAGAFTIPIIQMGARVYLPTAGRFLQVDPIEGGTANAYVYAGDPINANDYTGKATCSQLIGAICGVLFQNVKGQVTPKGPLPSLSVANTASRQASRTRGTGRTAAPQASRVQRASVLGKVGSGIAGGASRVGGGIAAGATWFGSGLSKGAQKTVENPLVQGVSEGCLVGAAGGLAAGGAVWLLGGPGVTLAELGTSCALGAMGGYYDSLVDGSGQSFRDLDTFNGMYKMFQYFNYR